MAQKKSSTGARKSAAKGKTSVTKTNATKAVETAKSADVVASKSASSSDKSIEEMLSESKGAPVKPDARAVEKVATKDVAKSEKIEAPKDKKEAPKDIPAPQKTAKEKRGMGFGGGLALLLAGGIGGVFASPHVADKVPSSIGQYLSAGASSDASSLVDELAVRIDTVEGALNDMPAGGSGEEIAALSAKIQELESQPSIPATGENGEVVDLAPILAEIEALKAENAALNEKVTEELAAVAQETSAKVEEARSQVEKAEATSALANLKLNLASGADVSADIAALEAAGITIPDVISSANSDMTLDDLHAEFGPLATDAIRASVLATGAEGSGMFGSLSTRFKAQFSGRSTTPQEGNTPDAILSRAEALVIDGQVQSAIDELSHLSSEALEIMTPWIDNAQAFAGTEGALQDIENQITG